MKIGNKLQWDANKEDFVGAADASALLTRNLRKPWDLIKLEILFFSCAHSISAAQERGG